MTGTTSRYDYFGQELEVGDSVIYGTTMSEGRGFNIGTVIKFTPKKVFVENPLKKGRLWVKDKSKEYGGHWVAGPEQSQCYPEQLCKVDPGLFTIKLLGK